MPSNDLSGCQESRLTRVEKSPAAGAEAAPLSKGQAIVLVFLCRPNEKGRAETVVSKITRLLVLHFQITNDAFAKGSARLELHDHSDWSCSRTFSFWCKWVA